MSASPWDARFLALAQHISAWSKDPSTQVGAVIVDKQRRIVSTGYNGPPRFVDDGLAQRDRETKLRITLHAEDNALAFARHDLSGCAIYVWPMPPCAQCAARIVQAGITRVVSPGPTLEQAQRWGEDFILAGEMYESAGVQLEAL